MKKIMFSNKYGLTQAVINGTKTVTRRLITDGIDIFILKQIDQFSDHLKQDTFKGVVKNASYKISEVVAVAQSYSEIGKERNIEFGYKDKKGYSNKMFVSADLMPYKILITSVRVERLQDIKDEDCLREGIVKTDTGYAFKNPQKEGGLEWFNNPRSAFAELIDKVSGKGTWERNPWVYVYEFALVK